MQNHQYVLTYWNMRGTTQALRYLLEYLRVDYEDRALDWPSDREYSLRDMIEFPKMPNLNHKGFEVTEIVPIGKYICRASKQTELLGRTPRDEVIIDSFVSKTFHARNIYLEALGALQNAEESVFEKGMFERLKVIRETFIKEAAQTLISRDWYMGYLSIADFFLYNVLVYFVGFAPSIITQESIGRYMKRFQSLEPLKQYFQNGKGNYPPALTEALNRKWRGKTNTG